MDVFLCASGPHLGGLTDRSAVARDTAGKEVVRAFDPCFSGTTRAIRASPAPRHRLLEG